MSGGTRKDGPGGNSSGKSRYQNPRGGYGGGGTGGLARGKMTNSHCMPAPVQLESMRRSAVDEYESLTPQGGGGGGGGGGGWSKEGKDEEEKGTKLEKREEGWKKPEVTPTLAHGFQDEFPSLTEQEKLSAKEKEELGKRHHQEAPPSHDSKSHYLRSDTLPRSSGSAHSAPPHHTHHHYQSSSLPYAHRDNSRSSRTSNYERSHHRQPRGPKQQRHLPYPPPPPQSRSQSSNDPYSMSYFCDMPPPGHSSLSTASGTSYSTTPDERRKRQPGGGGGAPLSSGHASSITRPIDVPDDDEDEGWAGHHEDIDYSKEVVFEDSSDEEFDQKRRSKNEDDDYPRKGGVSPPTHSTRGDMYPTDDRYHSRSYHHGNNHPQQRGGYREGYEREGHTSRPHPLILKKDRASPIQSDMGGVIGEAPPTPDTPPISRNAPKKILIRDLAEETDPSHAPQTDPNRASDQSESRVKMAWGPVPTSQPLSLVGGTGERKEEGGRRNEDASRGSDEREERRPSFEEDDNKVYDIKDRGPIASDKVLYEPEGKTSEEKFRKYHRMSSGDSTGAPRGGKGGKNEKQLAMRSVPSPDDVFIEDTGSGHKGNKGRKGKRFQNDSPVPPPQQHTPSPTYGKEDKRREQKKVDPDYNRKGDPEYNRREGRERGDDRRERGDDRRDRKDWGKKQERRQSDDKEEPRKVGGAGGRGKGYDNRGREEYRGGREEERWKSGSNNNKSNWEREQTDAPRRSGNRSDSHSSKQEQRYQNEHKPERRTEKQSDERRRGSQSESQKPASPVSTHERRTQNQKPQSERRAQQKDRDLSHLPSEGKTEQFETENRPRPQDDRIPHPHEEQKRTRPQDDRRPRPQDEQRPHPQDGRRNRPQDERRSHSQTQLEDEYKSNKRSQQKHQREQRYTEGAQRYPEDAQRYTESAQRYTEDVRYRDKKPKQTGRPSPTEHEQPWDTLSKPQDTTSSIIGTKSGDVSKSQDTRSSKPQDRPKGPATKPQDTLSKSKDTVSKSQDTSSKSQDIASTSKPTTKSQDIKNKPHPPSSQRPHPDDYEWIEDDRRSYNTGRGRGRRDHYSRQNETPPTSFPSLTFGSGYRGNRRGRGGGRGGGGGGGRGRRDGGRDHRETEPQQQQQHSSYYYNELEYIDSGSDWEDDDLLTDYEKKKKTPKEEKKPREGETRRERGGEKDLRNDRKTGGVKEVGVVKEVGGALEGPNKKPDNTRSYEGPDPPLISTPPMMPRVGVVSPGGGGAKKSDGLLPTPKMFPEGILMLGSPVGGTEHGSHDNDGFTVVGSSKREKQKDKEKKRRNGPLPKHQYEEESRPGKGGGAKQPVEQSRVWSQSTPHPPKEVWSETEEKKEPSLDSDIVVPPTTAGQYGAIGDKSSRSQSSNKDASSVSHERRSENNYRLFDNNNSGTPTFALQPKSSGGELHVLSEAIDSTLTDPFKVKTDPQLDPILEPPGSKPHPQETTPFQSNPVPRQGQAPPSTSSKTTSQDKKRPTNTKRSQNNDRFYTPPPARTDGGGRSNTRTSSSHKTSSSHAGQKGGGGGGGGERGGERGERGWNSGSGTNRHSKVMATDQSREDPDLEEGGEGEGDSRPSKTSHSRFTGQQQHQRGGGGGGGVRAVGSAKPSSENSKNKIKIDTSLVEKSESSQVSKFGSISYASALKNRPVVSHTVEPVRVTGQTSSDPVPLSIPPVIEDVPISPTVPPEVSDINNSPLSWKSETVPLSPLPPMGVAPEVLGSPVVCVPPVDVSEAIPLQTTPIPEPIPLPVPPQSTIVPVDPGVPSSSYPFDLRGGEGPLGAEPEGVEILATVEPHSDVKSNLNITANEFVPYHRSVPENSHASSSSPSTGLTPSTTPLVTTVLGKPTNKQPKSTKTTSSSLAKVPSTAVLSSAPPVPQQQQSLLNQPPPHVLHVLHQLQVAVLTASQQQQQQQQHSKRSKPTTSHVSGTTSVSTSRLNPVNHSSSSAQSSSQPVLQSIPHYPAPPPGGGSQPIPLMVPYTPHHSYPPPPPPAIQSYQSVKSRVQAQPPPIDIVQTIRPVHPSYIERADGIHASMAPPIHPVLSHGLSHQGIASVVPTTLQAPPTLYPSSHLPHQLATPSHVFMSPALPAGTGGLPVTFQQINPSLSRVPISTPTHIQSIEPKIHSTVRPPLLPTPPNFNLLVSATPTRPVQTTMATPTVFAPPPAAVWTGMRLGTSLNGSGHGPPPQHIVSPEGHPMALPHQVV